MGVRWTLLALAVLVMTLSQTSAKPAAQAEAGNQPGEMTNALNYLAELDKYYSNVARPSIDMLRVRRVNQNLSSALEKLSAIKNYYSEMGRSRFGKRSSPAMMSKKTSPKISTRFKRQLRHLQQIPWYKKMSLVLPLHNAIARFLWKISA